MSIAVETLIHEAISLRSELGENPEYDRALVELTTFATGGTQDDIETMSRRLGIVDVTALHDYVIVHGFGAMQESAITLARELWSAGDDLATIAAEIVFRRLTQ